MAIDQPGYQEDDIYQNMIIDWFKEKLTDRRAHILQNLIQSVYGDDGKVVENDAARRAMEVA